MAHQIDETTGKAAFVSFGAPAWHGLGKTFQEELTSQQALEEGGLNFDVYKLPNVHVLPDREVISTESFFTFRDDTNAVLGAHVGKDYEVFQNSQCFEVVDEILQAGTGKIETAGAIFGGRKVFICMKVAKDIVVGSSDVVEQYVLFCTSHDGSMSITALPTNVRVVCNNTLTAALRNSKKAVKIRHTKNASARLEEAVKVMGMIRDNTQINADNYGKMAETVISRAEMFDYFGNIFYSDEEIKKFQKGEKFKDVLSTQKQNIITEVLDFANTGVGQSLAMKGNEHTYWSAYGAVTGYLTRKKYRGADGRAESLLFGGSAAKIAEAGVLALEPEKIKPCTQQASKIITGFNLN